MWRGVTPSVLIKSHIIGAYFSWSECVAAKGAGKSPSGKGFQQEAVLRKNSKWIRDHFSETLYTQDDQ
jgi:hypothetical protein